ncbi:MAG: hypothetical protein NC115_11260 [Bacteroidales bacterium]|nr:hypothetical protein [Bacteroides sp.]MCM1198885.1 hypothetical protein [Clostridium sp.]MCM1503224.1 hypothetical protein [Bacteroidales bacterium]
MANVAKTLKNIFIAMVRGELLLRMGADRYLIHIVYLFILIVFTLFANLKMDETMVRREQNRKILEDTRIFHAQKTCELAGYDRISKVQELLRQSGSRVTLPEKKAERLK